MSGAAFGAPMVLSQQAKGANERIGVGFIGTGGRCNAHLGIVNTFQASRTSPSPWRCATSIGHVWKRRRKKTGGAKMYTEHEALLQDPSVDVVCIASPDRLHAPQTIDALNAGKDVYCEKPLTHWSQFEAAKQIEADRTGYRQAGAGRHPVHGRRQLSGDHPADRRRNDWQAGACRVQFLSAR